MIRRIARLGAVALSLLVLAVVVPDSAVKSTDVALVKLDRADGVELRRSRVVLDVLAVQQLARGVTARVLLEFRTTGSVEKRVRVQGRLYLTHEDDGWQVFGYDMTKGAV